MPAFLPPVHIHPLTQSYPVVRSHGVWVHTQRVFLCCRPEPHIPNLILVSESHLCRLRGCYPCPESEDLCPLHKQLSGYHSQMCRPQNRLHLLIRPVGILSSQDILPQSPYSVPEFLPCLQIQTRGFLFPASALFFLCLPY